jgi:hypothetical protein
MEKPRSSPPKVGPGQGWESHPQASRNVRVSAVFLRHLDGIDDYAVRTHERHTGVLAFQLRENS